MQKNVLGVLNAPPRHWVGDGFHVHGIFNYQQHAQLMSPFLLLDYASPSRFEPLAAGQRRRGVGEHPHRGIETVTIVYDGEVQHRDSTGNGGVIGPGDVQWMTAGGGIMHEEFHSEKFSHEGGDFHMVQLWVNLPAKDKMTSPGYQGITDAQIVNVPLPEGAGQVRVIAGEYSGKRGPASTFTPLNLWDVNLAAGKSAALAQPEGWSTALLVTKGEVTVNGGSVKPMQMIVLSRDGSELQLQASSDAKLLLMAGEPINEPVVGYGPFVMNTREEIVQTVNDLNSGKFGRI